MCASLRLPADCNCIFMHEKFHIHKTRGKLCSSTESFKDHWVVSRSFGVLWFLLTALLLGRLGRRVSTGFGIKAIYRRRLMLHTNKSLMNLNPELRERVESRLLPPVQRALRSSGIYVKMAEHEKPIDEPMRVKVVLFTRLNGLR